jgi:hypothetical protein
MNGKGGWHGQRREEAPEEDREAQVQEAAETDETSTPEQVGR